MGLKPTDGLSTFGYAFQRGQARPSPHQASDCSLLAMDVADRTGATDHENSTRTSLG